MRVSATLSLLLALLALGACQDDAARLQAHMTRGDEYFSGDRYRESIIEYKSALQIDPNFADAHYKLAQAYLRTGKGREGFWELRETVRLDPDNHDAKLEFSQIAILAGEKEDALAQSTSVTESEPNNAHAWLVRGQALDSLDRRDEALESYGKALEVDPDNENALRVYAKALTQRDRADEVEPYMDHLVQVHPSFDNYSAQARYLRSQGPERKADELAAIQNAIASAEGRDRAMGVAQLVSFYVRNDQVPAAFDALDKAIAEADEETGKVDLIYLLARLYRTQGDLEKADQVVESSAAAAPNDPQVHLVLSAYRARNGDFEGALVAAERAVELAPDLKRARLQKAEILMELGFKQKRDGAVDQARELVDGILATEPSDPDALFADAKLKLGQGDIDAAIASLRAALDSRQNWAEAHYLLGVALAVKKDYSGARTELAQALENDAALLDAKNVLSQVHYKLGEWEYCIEWGKAYLREKPEDSRARLLVAQSLVRLGRVKEAQAELAQIPDDARNGEVYYALGRIEQGKGNLDKAHEYLIAANDDMPNQYDILQALLLIDGRNKKLDESKARINAALEAEPENAQLNQLAGVLALMEGRGEDAEASFRKAIELDPYDLSGYERLARYYARTGRLEETARTYEQALEVKPDEAQLHHFLGVLYELSGDKERAIERYEEAIRHKPDLAEAKNNLAYIYAESGQNLDRALELAQSAKQQLPNSPSVADTLGWVLYKRGVLTASINYLQEAEAGTKADDESLAVVRFHLAQAYDANGDSAEALAALDRSLGTLEQQMQSVRDRGGDPGPEPAWAADARALRDKLQARTAGT